MPEWRIEALRRVGAIVEVPQFHSHLSGRDNLRATAACRDRDASGRVEAVLDRVGLVDRAGDRVGGKQALLRLPIGGRVEASAGRSSDGGGQFTERRSDAVAA
ncbi:hypothetical protein ABT369_50735 [Dactylosporangium sp. NPDC000244]|uniref:hypothetical protein n=1 Tax=Dactylosporangium sp. NPDC000244 TaxID=3154365 RepID=UPI0033175E53